MNDHIPEHAPTNWVAVYSDSTVVLVHSMCRCGSDDCGWTASVGEAMWVRQVHSVEQAPEPHFDREPGPYLWMVCERCNYDRHQCGGCGQDLRHDGRQLDGSEHENCCA